VILHLFDTEASQACFRLLHADYDDDDDDVINRKLLYVVFWFNFCA